MMQASWSHVAARKIRYRVVVEGDLVLDTPAHFGNGETGEMTDLPVAADFLDGKTPVITGATVAGALRSYLIACQKGYRETESYGEDLYASILFGGSKGDDSGKQSPLIVEDAIGKRDANQEGDGFAMEVREGVAIDPKSRTASDNMLYSRQLWCAGTTFRLRFELLLVDDAGNDDNKQENKNRKQALATALLGLKKGDITLGARKRRGYGKVSVTNWRAETYDLMSCEGLVNWLKRGSQSPNGASFDDPTKALGVEALPLDKRQSLKIRAEFTLNGSMLIRGSGPEDVGPDMQHLHSNRNKKSKPVPILSGTSLAGALRARATRIAKTLTEGGHADRVNSLISKIFGSESGANGHPEASRLTVEESEIHDVAKDTVQDRVSIDRFTGGAVETALFSEMPVFATNKTSIEINLSLQNPKDREVGLLLLLLKDLWTGDLALGGEISVGRGRLQGIQADLEYRDGQVEIWKVQVEEKDKKLVISGTRSADELQKYVDELGSWLSTGDEKE